MLPRHYDDESVVICKLGAGIRNTHRYACANGHGQGNMYEHAQETSLPVVLILSTADKRRI